MRCKINKQQQQQPLDLCLVCSPLATPSITNSTDVLESILDENTGDRDTGKINCF